MSSPTVRRPPQTSLTNLFSFLLSPNGPQNLSQPNTTDSHYQWVRFNIRETFICHPLPACSFQARVSDWTPPSWAPGDKPQTYGSRFTETEEQTADTKLWPSLLFKDCSSHMKSSHRVHVLFGFYDFFFLSQLIFFGNYFLCFHFTLLLDVSFFHVVPGDLGWISLPL